MLLYSFCAEEHLLTWNQWYTEPLKTHPLLFTSNSSNNVQTDYESYIWIPSASNNMTLIRNSLCPGGSVISGVYAKCDAFGLNLDDDFCHMTLAPLFLSAPGKTIQKGENG